MLKKYSEICIALAISLILFALGYFTGSRYTDKPGIEERTDTLYIRDTVTLPVPPAESSVVSRVDTCWLPAVTPEAKPSDIPQISEEQPDTTATAVEIPIETKVYETDDYRAVVSGFRPSLDDMTVYPKTRYVTKEVTITKQKRWNFTIGPQVGFGYTPAGVQPYLGVGATFGYSF